LSGSTKNFQERRFEDDRKKEKPDAKKMEILLGE
jgi:hypothetical protein